MKTKDKHVSYKGTHYKELSIIEDRLRAFIEYETRRPEYQTSERLQGEVQAFQALLSLMKQLQKKGVWVTDDDIVFQTALEAAAKEYDLELGYTLRSL